MKQWLAIILIITLLLSGCALRDDEIKARHFSALDTDISLYAQGNEAEEALKAGEAEVKRLDVLYSPNEGSDIYTLNQNSTATVSPELAALLARGQTFSAQTDGYFSMTIAPLMDAWGFLSKEYRVPSSEEREALVQKIDDSQINIDGTTVTIPQGWSVDVGGIAKGAISDAVLNVMDDYDIETASVSLGGNVQLMGPKADGSAWSVGIQDPEKSDELCANLKIDTAQAVITSGGYERYFESDGVTYHHIIDPRTGMPAAGQILSVTIVSPDGTMADALSTALFVMDVEDAKNYWRSHSDAFECIIVCRDKTIYASQGLEGIVEAGEGYTLEMFA